MTNLNKFFKCQINNKTKLRNILEHLKETHNNCNKSEKNSYSTKCKKKHEDIKQWDIIESGVKHHKQNQPIKQWEMRHVIYFYISSCTANVCCPFIMHCVFVGFITTSAISANHHWCCEFESRSGRGVQHYVIKFVSEL